MLLKKETKNQIRVLTNKEVKEIKKKLKRIIISIKKK